jgi:type II secretory pathway pseudopilin PulG
MVVMRRTTQRYNGLHFSVLQLLIVCAITGVVAALAIPAFGAQAKKSVLRQNAETLALQVKSDLALDHSLEYVADGDGAVAGDDDPQALSTALSGALRSGAPGHFVNPFSGSRAIVCAAAPPASSAFARPAVWITDDPHYAYAQFRPSAVTRSQLAGALVVAFVTRDGVGTVDVYFVDGAGERSPAAAALALSDDDTLPY